MLSGDEVTDRLDLFFTFCLILALILNLLEVIDTDGSFLLLVEPIHHVLLNSD